MKRALTALMSKARSELGQALIETALTMPIVLALSISVFEFGRAFQYWQVMTNAAREGARLASLPGTTEDDVRARVYAYLEGGRIASFASATISVDPVEVSIGADTQPGSKVTVSYPFEFIALQPIVQLLVSDSTVGEAFTMSTSATMRDE